MELTKKVLAIIVIFSVIGTAVALAAVFNLGGFGTAVAGAGGPAAAGIYKIGNAPLLWASSGGWPTLAAFYLGFVALIFAFAWVIWHFDVPYKITGATAAPEIQSHVTTREPEEPERAPQPQSVPVEKGT